MSDKQDKKKKLDLIESGRAEIESGNYRTLMITLWVAACRREPIPHWLVRALGTVVNAAVTHQVKSWDDMLGRPLKKGERLKQKRRHLEISYPLWQRVQEAKRQGKGIDRELFDSIGKEFGISGALAEKIYYAPGSRLIHEAMAMSFASNPT